MFLIIILLGCDYYAMKANIRNINKYAFIGERTIDTAMGNMWFENNYNDINDLKVKKNIIRWQI